MKKNKTINKLLSSLTLLSPLTSIGFNSQYQNTQTVITENSTSLNKYFFNQTNEEQRTMGDITVTVDGTVITGYVKGEGKLIVDSDITEIGARSFQENENITSLDLSQAISLKTINDECFYFCSNLTGNLFIPNKVITVADGAFKGINITSLDLSQATSLTSIGDRSFASCSKLTIDSFPQNLTTISSYAFEGSRSVVLDLSQAVKLNNIGENSFCTRNDNQGNFIFPSNIKTIKNYFENNYYRGASCPIITDMFFLSSTLTFSSNWKPNPGEGRGEFIKGDIYVYPGTKETVVADPNFGYDSSRVQEWSFDSSASSINGSFDNINIKTTDVGNIETQYQVSGGLSVEGLANCFAYELVPTGSTQTIPNGLYFYDKKIYWDNVPEGQYEFKIKAHLDETYSIESNQTITINVTGDTPIPPEPTPKKSNIPLILGLLIGLGIPVILAIAFIIWYLTKKKKTTVKI